MCPSKPKPSPYLDSPYIRLAILKIRKVNVRNQPVFLGIVLVIVMSAAANSAEPVSWPNGAKTAVSLSYDDALDSQLDNAAPSLDRHEFKASFYLTLASPSVGNRLSDWRALASRGHELGNHTIYHPCSGSLPDRGWVKPYHDMDTRTIEQMEQEVLTANAFLHSIDGKTQRTFTPPCGDLLASGENYLPAVREYFVAIKGQEVPTVASAYLGPAGTSGNELIEFVKGAANDGKMAHIIFHGIGGDHLSVSNEAHDELLEYLADNRETYWVDTYMAIMKHVANGQGQ